jgi:hypothetical protein
MNPRRRRINRLTRKHRAFWWATYHATRRRILVALAAQPAPLVVINVKVGFE